MGKKKPKEGTKALEAYEIRKLKKKCLKLWKEVVKLKAGNKCVICGVGPKGIHGHHLEDYRMNSALRYAPENGVSCCAKHHKFNKNCFEHSFITTYEYMTIKRPNDIEFLRAHKDEKVEFTKSYLLNTIKVLEGLKNLYLIQLGVK